MPYHGFPDYASYMRAKNEERERLENKRDLTEEERRAEAAAILRARRSPPNRHRGEG